MKTAKYYLVFSVNEYSGEVETKSFKDYAGAYRYASAVNGCVEPVF
jgi:hypothetical protein